MTTLKRVFCLLALLLGLLGAPLPEAAAQGLPGLGQKAAPAEEPGFLSRAYFEIQQLQATTQRRLTGIVRDIKAGEGLAAAALLIVFSFLYGIFHAAGPGHGKIVISSYLLTHDSRIRNGVLISFASALVQAVSAILLVGLFAVVLSVPHLQVTGHVRTLELVSYALIVALGLWMLYGALTGKTCCHGGHDHDHGHSHDHGHDHGHGHGHGHSHGPDTRAGRANVSALILAVGVRPCSGAVIVLLFTMANGLLAYGVAATLAMAVGTGLTVSLLGIASVYGNRLAGRVGRFSEVWEARLRQGLALAGALFITAIGAILFAVTLDTTERLI